MLNLDLSADIANDTESISISRLCADVAVVIWDLPGARTSTKCTLETSEQLVPLVSLNIPLETGGQRILWAMRTKDEPISLTLSAGALGPTEQAILYPAVELASFDVDRAVDNLAAAGHIKLLNNVMGTWRSAFRLSQNQIFASVARELTLALTPEPRQVRFCGQPIDGQHLLETALDPDLGDMTAIYAISANAVTALPTNFVIGPPIQKKAGNRAICLSSRPGVAAIFPFCVSGKNGIAVRKLSDSDGQPVVSRNGGRSGRATWNCGSFLCANWRKYPVLVLPLLSTCRCVHRLAARQIAKSATHPAAEIDLALALMAVSSWAAGPTIPQQCSPRSNTFLKMEALCRSSQISTSFQAKRASVRMDWAQT